ncbi:MAG: hypothetical protein OEU93_12040, partial [Rubrivivax sp.]|nr:hypothetical protein [Rubrivivax sp.]
RVLEERPAAACWASKAAGESSAARREGGLGSGIQECRQGAEWKKAARATVRLFLSEVCSASGA